jgi:hypothetical protein
LFSKSITGVEKSAPLAFTSTSSTLAATTCKGQSSQKKC